MTSIIIILILLFFTLLALFWAWIFAIAYHNIEQQFRQFTSYFYFPLPEPRLEPPPNILSINFQKAKKTEHKAIASKISTMFMFAIRPLLGKVCRIPEKIYWSIIGSKKAVINADIIGGRQPIRTILMLLKRAVKINTKMNKKINQKKQRQLTEKRVREIAREEIYKWHKLLGRYSFVSITKKR